MHCRSIKKWNRLNSLQCLGGLFIHNLLDERELLNSLLMFYIVQKSDYMFFTTIIIITDQLILTKRFLKSDLKKYPLDA